MRYLQVSYRKGKPFAAYLRLSTRSTDRSARTEKREGGLLVDFTADGRPMGIEITAPSKVTLDALNQALAAVQQEPATPAEFAPLQVAQT